MFERFARSWALVQASANVLRNDKELLVLPAVSGLCSLVLIAAFLAPAYMTGALQALAGEAHDSGQADATATLTVYALLFVFYICQYFVVIFFNTALVGAALLRLEGHNPTLGDAISIAMARIGVIAGYAVISATVGVLLRMIAERLGFVGRIVESLVGLAWTVSTFLVVPIIAARGVGPIEAVRESASLLRKTWGENLIGNGGIGLAISFVTLPVVIVGVGASMYLFGHPGMQVGGVMVAAVTVLAIAAISIFGAALGGVYSAAVYQYAQGGSVMRGFDRSLLEEAFRHKKGGSGA